MNRQLLLIVLLAMCVATAFAQEEGCNDIFATNYDAGTVVDDGSCVCFMLLSNSFFHTGSSSDFAGFAK